MERRRCPGREHLAQTTQLWHASWNHHTDIMKPVAEALCIKLGTSMGCLPNLAPQCILGSWGVSWGLWCLMSSPRLPELHNFPGHSPLMVLAPAVSSGFHPGNPRWILDAQPADKHPQGCSLATHSAPELRVHSKSPPIHLQRGVWF